MGRHPARAERNGLLRLLSLELALSDPRCAELLSDEALLAAMARFEGALARASAARGMVPPADAQVIAEVCEGARFDSRALALAAREAGALAIPFVKELTRQVGARSTSAARYVHLGATSQDVLDTALVLCLRRAGEHIEGLSRGLGDALAALASAHAATPSVARTLLQPALPVPFGWKAAVWLSMLARCHAAFASALREASVLQLGGAAGTLSAYGEAGDGLAQAVAAELDLRAPEITWHSARDAIARLGSEAALLAGAAAKVARDVSLLMQPEVGEAVEPAGPGRGGSSAMPHKRNPALSLLALEAGQRAPGLAATLLAQLAPEHERGLGHWQGQFLTMRALLGATASGLAAMGEAIGGLQVDARAMRTNLDASLGLVYSEAVAMRLASDLGKAAAHALTERLCLQAAREGHPLKEVIRGDAGATKLLGAQELEALFDPARAFGAAPAMIERTLAAWRRARQT